MWRGEVSEHARVVWDTTKHLHKTRRTGASRSSGGCVIGRRRLVQNMSSHVFVYFLLLLTQRFKPPSAAGPTSPSARVLPGQQNARKEQIRGCPCAWVATPRSTHKPLHITTHVALKRTFPCKRFPQTVWHQWFSCKRFSQAAQNLRNPCKRLFQ